MKPDLIKHITLELKTVSEKLKETADGLLNLISLLNNELKELEYAEKNNNNNDNKIIRFKTEKQKEEFYNGKLNIQIKYIIYGLAAFLYNEYGYKITITEVWREKLNKYTGIHHQWRAVDIRDQDMNETIRKATEIYLSHYHYPGVKKTVLRHDVGKGSHFHIQCSWCGYTIISVEKEQ